MSFEEHLTHFAGLPVADWEPGQAITDPTGAIYRLGTAWGDDLRWLDKLAAFLDDPAVGRIVGLVVGRWISDDGTDNSAEIVEALVAARDRLPELRAIFLGDIIREENEVSWIQQGDVSPLFDAYPALEHFAVRGTSELSLGALSLAHLQSLTIQSGGLNTTVYHQAVSARLPALSHLELWLGTENYGANVTVEDLAPLLSGDRFPALSYLGLRNSQIADEIAAVIARAPILGRIRVLDLSMGTLGDEGAAALLASPAVARLEKLDIHRHYCTEEMMRKLEGLGIEVDASDRQDEGKYGRYVAVGE